MASLFQIFHFCLLLFLSPSITLASFRPKALILPVFKDTSTLQYLTQIKQRTPLVPLNLTIDLGGQFLWVYREKDYVSSSYKQGTCRSAQCSLARALLCQDCSSASPNPSPGCNNNTCTLLPDNNVIRTATFAELSQDVVPFNLPMEPVPVRSFRCPSFSFTCGATFMVEGLANGVTGMAGLGRHPISIPSLFSAAFSFDRKFAICLTSSTKSKGVIFFGNGPYIFHPNIDVSKDLIYTPLILNPVSTDAIYYEGSPSTEYFVQVKSIKINGKTVPLNSSLLSIDDQGNGGTKISTVNPYILLETSIYNAVIKAFVQEINANVSQVAAVSPFGACFSSNNIGKTRAGPAVPPIDLVLQRVVDGGLNPRTSIVIGGHQLEDNLIQIDQATSRLGFSSSLLLKQTTCSNFNFTSIA
ncbi:Peptidase A1 [Corchorus capsularis]|uniref:Peptidase A1 n=1 Tax=Corchorus capsularis TaxID=210143 RepID=A0A1R3JVV3_COCAP|nr:Peptidase A1 [Corchorus capsularis]